MKIENISLKRELEEEKRKRFNIEKQMEILKQLENNKINPQNQSLKLLIFSLLNKEDISGSSFYFKILSELFNRNEINWSRFLAARVDALEFQNFKLNSKQEIFSNTITNYINELIEFIEVISYFKNVVNQIFESQSLTQEFFLIRETLNSRDSFMESQKNFFLEEKKNIQRELNNDMKFNLLLTHDKISENYLNILKNEKQEGILQIVGEKIKEMQKMVTDIALYDDFLDYKEERGLIKQSEIYKKGNSLSREGLLNENY